MLFVGALLVGCGPEPVARVTSADVIGSYTYRDGSFVRKLILRPDGVFLQIESAGKVVRRNQGRWRLDRDTRGDTRLYLDNFAVGLATGSGQTGLLSVPMMETMGGRLVICPGEESESCFERDR
jgi:hypothetical protein